MILSLVAWCILRLFGWHSLSETTLNLCRNIRRGIGVYPHTSIWDGILMGLYRLAYPQELSHVHVLVAKRFFVPLIGTLLRWNGCIPVENQKSHCNQVESIREQLALKKDFLLVVSPKGSSGPRPWKKGFVLWAQALQCPIVILGLDYREKRAEMLPEQITYPGHLVPESTFPIFSPPISKQVVNNMEKEKDTELGSLKRRILQGFALFQPLYPENEPEVKY